MLTRQKYRRLETEFGSPLNLHDWRFLADVLALAMSERGGLTHSQINRKRHARCLDFVNAEIARREGNDNAPAQAQS